MRLLDLFCGAGGSAEGYRRAGFDYILGVDIVEQPNYPFAFVKLDAMGVLASRASGRRTRWHKFDAIHASPPCQDYSKNMKHLARPGTPRLIEPVLELLSYVRVPWIVENVDGAPLPKQDDLFGRSGVQICGTSLGLRVYRHRLFESNVQLQGTHCDHRLPALNPHNQAGRDRLYAEFGRGDPEVHWRKAMGVEWMKRYEAREAIPPGLYRIPRQAVACGVGNPTD